MASRLKYAYAQTIELTSFEVEITSEPYQDGACEHGLVSSVGISGDILIFRSTLASPAFLGTDLHHYAFAGAGEHKPSPIKQATYLANRQGSDERFGCRRD